MPTADKNVVTRPKRERFARVDPFEWAVAVVAVGGGIGWPLAMGAVTPVETMVTAVVGVVLSAALLFVPAGQRVLGLVIVFFGGLFACARVDRPLMLVWFTAVCLGILVGSQLRYLQRRRAEAAAGRASKTTHPRVGEAVGSHGLSVVWDAGSNESQAVDPDLGLVEQAIHSLNGADHTIVSIFRGDGRFDVGGNATGDVLVYQSDDKRHFHWATTPGAASDSETQVTIAGIPGRFSRRQVVTVDAALAAARTFVATGQRDSALTWLDDTTSLVVRPPRLDEP